MPPMCEPCDTINRVETGKFGELRKCLSSTATRGSRMNFFKKTVSAATIVLISGAQGSAFAAAPSEEKVVQNYANIAHAMYQDSMYAAELLRGAVKKFVKKPTRVNLIAARFSWLAAREPYQQTEGFRFGNAIVDDWEGKVNAWPLDEGLIDYVAASYGKSSKENAYYTANIIANPKLKLGGRKIDATKITAKLLSDTLHEIDKVEANVATGYHAIEFLLWGQDLNGSGPGAGNRSHTDFDTKNCTNGNCDRRAAYLTAATDLLLSDLAEI